MGEDNEGSTDPFGAAEYRVRGIYWRFKRPIGFVLALLVTIMWGPLLLCIAATLAYGGSPVLIRRRRLGRYGRPFNSYCFRTMVRDSLTGLGASDDSPLVTNKVGRFLKRTRLDAAPLIWSVLKGDMNVVGPRSLSQEEYFGSGRAAWRTLAVRPGITGLWWLEGESDLRRRLALDRTYIEHANPWIDLRVVLKTFVVMHRDASGSAASRLNPL